MSAGRLAKLGADTTAARKRHLELVAERDELILDLRAAGYTHEGLAEIAGLKYQQVQQIVKRGERP